MKTSGKSSLTPPERKNSEKDAERIAGDIAQSIRSGELAPGTRLQAEGKLTERYGSNVYSVRKAVAQLKSQGLLYSVPKFGVFVSKVVQASPEAAAIPPLDGQTCTTITFATRSTLKLQKQLWEQVARDFSAQSPLSEMRTLYCGENGILPDADIIEEGTLSSGYLTSPALMEVGKYFPEAIPESEQMLDTRGIPFYYAAPVLLYNLDLLEKLGFSAPAYRNFEEQMLYLEQVMEKAVHTPGLRASGTAQSVIIRLGGCIHEIFQRIREHRLDRKTFISEYGKRFHSVTDFWKKYPANYPKQARNSYIDFLAGDTPFFLGLTSDYTRLLESAPAFRCGGAMMYAADDTYSRILVVLAINAATRHPVESLRLIRQFQSAPVQKRITELGGLPLRKTDDAHLPYQLVIPEEKAAPPLYFRSPEEYYVCVNIINEELWNIILFHKKIEDAMGDALMFSEAYLKMRSGNQVAGSSLRRRENIRESAVTTGESCIRAAGIHLPQ